MRLTYEERSKVRDLYASGISQFKIAKMFHTSWLSINRIVTNKNTSERNMHPTINASEADLIYMAGYFDGEGSITITRGNNINVRLSNTYKPTLVWMYELVGGYLYIHNHDKNTKGRQLYTWSLNAYRAIAFLKLIAPFLREKKYQAELAIKFSEFNCYSGYKEIPETVVAERNKIMLALKDAKHINHESEANQV